MGKYRLPLLSYNALSGNWMESEDDDPDDVSLCHKATRKLFGFKKKFNYQLTFYTKRPSKWAMSGHLLVEPIRQGHEIYFEKKGGFHLLDDSTADWLFRNVDFDKARIKIWIKIKKSPIVVTVIERQLESSGTWVEPKDKDLEVGVCSDPEHTFKPHACIHCKKG